MGVIVLLLVAKSFFGSKREDAISPARPSPVAPTATSSTLTLIGVDTVHVQVWHKNSDASYGEQLFDGTLARGQSRVIPRTGDLFITANPNENFAMESEGKRFTMKKLGNGSQTGQLPAP